MSHNNSDQVKQCLNQTNNSPRDQPTKTTNQPSATDPAARETNQAVSAEPSGSVGNKPSSTTPSGTAGNKPMTVAPSGTVSNQSTSTAPSGTMGNKPSSTTPSSTVGNKPSSTAPSGTVGNKPPTPAESPGGGPNPPAFGAGARRGSEGEPMDTTVASSLRSRVQLLPSYPISQLRRLQPHDHELTPLTAKGHTVLVDMNWLKSGTIVPYPGAHVWDGDHVKLPHMYPRPTSRGPSRWEVTRRALDGLTAGSFSVRDVQSAILSYNSSNKDKWSFDVLYHYGQKFDNKLYLVISKMAKLALELPSLILRSVPLLRQHQNRAVTLSQQQISCLLANAFFCTFPHRNDTRAGSEYTSYPSINFSSLFASRNNQEKLELKAEKLRAIFHYFNTVTESPSSADGLVTFERICVPPSQLPDWNKQRKQLTNLHVSPEGSIEREGTGMLQVDFASRFVGGGVLQSGLVQEEILFLMCPELIVARLFTEKLAHNECLRITGPQMYNLTCGYSKSFSWAGPFDDHTPCDVWKRRYRQIVAIDALDFKNQKEQYTKDSITRELNKAFVGFSGQPKTAVATGNWGCGAFRGDPQLKALIQLMAAAVADRDVAFFTFHNAHLAHEIQRMHEILTTNRVTVDQLYKLLKEYCGHHARERHTPKDLYRFIREKMSGNCAL